VELWDKQNTVLYSVLASLFTPLPLFTPIGKVLQFCLVLHQNYFIACYSPILHLCKIWRCCDNLLKQGILCNGAKSGNLCCVTFVRSILHSTIYKLVKPCWHHNCVCILYQLLPYMKRIRSKINDPGILQLGKFVWHNLWSAFPQPLYSHSTQLFCTSSNLSKMIKIALCTSSMHLLRYCKEFEFFQQELR